MNVVRFVRNITQGLEPGTSPMSVMVHCLHITVIFVAKTVLNVLKCNRSVKGNTIILMQALRATHEPNWLAVE